MRLSVPVIPPSLHLRAPNCGMWWCVCASDYSCVPRTRQSGMQPLSSRLPPVLPVCLCCQRLRRRTTTGRGQRAGQHDSGTTLLVSNFNGVFSTFSIAGVLSTRRWDRLRDEPEESCGGAGKGLPTPSPSGHAAFWIPPSISITLAVTGPHARRVHSVGVRKLQRGEADRSRYDRSTQSSTARQKRRREDGGPLRSLPRSQKKS